MPVINETGSPLAKPVKIEILLNFCRSVVRSDEDHLKLAMGQYEQFLKAEQSR